MKSFKWEGHLNTIYIRQKLNKINTVKKNFNVDQLLKRPLVISLSSIKTTNQLKWEAKTLSIVFSEFIQYCPILSAPSFAKYLTNQI